MGTDDYGNNGGSDVDGDLADQPSPTLPRTILVLALKVLNSRNSLSARSVMKAGHLSGGDGDDGMSRKVFWNHDIQGI